MGAQACALSKLYLRPISGVDLAGCFAMSTKRRRIAYYASWATKNNSHSILHEEQTSAMTKVGVYEQGGYGIVDISVDGQRFTNNNNGNLVNTINVPHGRKVVAIEVREQGG